MKTEERITKTKEEGPEPLSQPRPRRSWGRITAALGLFLLLAGAIGAAYNYYLLHRETTEGEIAEIEALIVAHKGEEARALMVGAQARSGNVAALRLRVGRAFLRQGEIAPATALLAQVEGSLIKEERLAMAEYLLGAGDPFTALKFFEAAMKTGLTRSASLLERYGEALLLSGNGEAAVAAFRESVSLDGTRTRIRLNLAVALANLGRFDEAKTETLALLKLEPTHQKAQQLLAAIVAQR